MNRIEDKISVLARWRLPEDACLATTVAHEALHAALGGYGNHTFAAAMSPDNPPVHDTMDREQEIASKAQSCVNNLCE